jgi:hypothetical protein
VSTREDLLGQPARVSLEDEELGAGRITDVEQPTPDHTRVTVANANGEIDVALDRVEITPRDDVIQLVREECSPPDASSTPSTMVSWPALLGACQRQLDTPLDDLHGLIREALIARELACVRYEDGEVVVGEEHDGETRYLFPVEERYVRKVIVEFGRPPNVSEGLIEHCRMLLRDECGVEVHA